MLKKINPYLTILVIGFLIVGCEKDCTQPKGIYGDWVWTKTVLLAGNDYTPELLGYSERLRIDDFTFERYVNDTLVFDSQYDLISRNDSLGNNKNFIIFDSGFEQEIHISETELVLVDNWILQRPSTIYSRQ